MSDDGATSDIEPARVIERARAGDVDAFTALIEHRQERMIRVASAILGDRGDADDAIQEAVVSVWRELPRLRQPDRFEAWFDRILVNACRLVLRRRARRGVREIDLDAVGPTTVGMARPTEDAVVSRDAFDRAFDTLGADARSLLVLRHLEGRSIAEISAALEIPMGTVKSRLFAARRALDEALRGGPA